jgi:aminopeptidase N
MICEKIFSEWDVTALFFTVASEGALITDSLSFSHPIFKRLENESDFPDLFDDITYDKGA